MHTLITAVVFVAVLVAIVCAIGVIWTAVPAVAGVAGAFLPLMACLGIGMGALWLAHTLSDHEQPAEVKALQAAEDALRARKEEARAKSDAQLNRAAASQQLQARKQKLQDDLEWERIQNDPVAKAKFEAEQRAENAAKRRHARDAEDVRLASDCDREARTWPERRLPVRCSAPEVARLMKVGAQQQALLAQDEQFQRQERLDRADAQRCDTYYLNWPSGRGLPRCSAPEVQRFMRVKARPSSAEGHPNE